MTEHIDCWHWSANTLRDGTPLPSEGVEPPPIRGKIILCCRGYHGSVRAIDALHYAPGTMVARVRIWGDILRGNDKAAGRQRVGLTPYMDATQVLQECARLYARQVLHHWGEPVRGVVLKYLYTGDRSLVAEARAEAGAAKAAKEATWAALAAKAAKKATWAAVAAESAKEATWAAKEATWAATWARAAAGAAEAAKEATWAVGAAEAAKEATWAAVAAEASAARARAAAKSRQNIALELRLGELLGVVV